MYVGHSCKGVWSVISTAYLTYGHNPRWGIGPDTLFHHAAWSRAATAASLHELKPTAVLSLLAAIVAQLCCTYAKNNYSITGLQCLLDTKHCKGHVFNYSHTVLCMLITKNSCLCFHRFGTFQVRLIFSTQRLTRKCCLDTVELWSLL